MLNRFVKSMHVLLVLLPLLLAGCGYSGANGATEQAAPTSPDEGPADVVLFAYVGANLKDPVSEIGELYEQKTGTKVEMTFNNAGMLLNQLENMKKGDIYIPGGMPFMEAAKERGHISEVMGPVAIHTPVIITPSGNPAAITTIEDLAKPGIKLVLPDKEATAIGRTVFKIFDRLGITEAIETNVQTCMETPAKVVATILLGQGDAGIVEYSNTFKEREKIDVLEISPEINITEEIPVCLLKYSMYQAEARDFMDFAVQEGPEVLSKYGFKTP